MGDPKIVKSEQPRGAETSRRFSTAKASRDDRPAEGGPRAVLSWLDSEREAGAGRDHGRPSVLDGVDDFRCMDAL
jgi:hypothetical protein